MKLPTRRSDVSRSMASAMRSPVLQDKNFVQSRAATQRFIPTENPKDYERLASAQANAALASGKVGLAFADAGINAADALIKVDAIEQKAAFDAKEAELRSWVGGYAGRLSGENLTEMVNGKRKYATVKENFESEYKKFKKELDQKYGITNGFLRQEFANKELGIKTAANNELDKFIRGAEAEVAQQDSLSHLDYLSTHRELEEWKETASLLFTPAQVQSMYEQKGNAISVGGFQLRINNAKNAGLGNAFLDGLEDELDILTARLVSPGEVDEDGRVIDKPYINEQGIKNVQSMIASQRRENITDAENALDNATTKDLASEIYEENLANGNTTHASAKWTEMYKKRLSELSSEEYKDGLTDDTGQPVDDPAVTSDIANKALVDGTLSDSAREDVIKDAGEAATSHFRHLTDVLWTEKGSLTEANAQLLEWSSWTPGQLGLADGDYAGKDRLLGEVYQHINQLQGIYDATIPKWDKETEMRMRAQNIVAGGTAPFNPWSKDASDHANYMFDAYRLADQSSQFPSHPSALLESFTKKFGVAPPEAVNGYAYIARTGKPEDAANALMMIQRLNNATMGNLPDQPGVKTDQVDEALMMSQHLEGLSGEAFLIARQNYASHELQGGKDKSGVQVAWKAWNAGKDEDGIPGSITKYWDDVYSEKHDIDAELSPEASLMIQVYLDEAFTRFNGNKELAMQSAMSVAMSRMGIEEGVVVVNSYFSAGIHANKEHSDDNEVLQRNKEDLAADAGRDSDEITITPIEDLDGNVVNIVTVNGEVAVNSNPESPHFGQPIVYDPDTLTPGAQRVADQRDADIAVKDSEAALEQSSATLGHQIVSQGVRGGDPNRISRSDRDLEIESALRERASSGDPVGAATAKAELEVLGSSVYNQLLADGQKDKAEKLKEDHIIAARTAAQAKVDRGITAAQTAEAVSSDDAVDRNKARANRVGGSVEDESGIEVEERKKPKAAKRGAGPISPKSSGKSSSGTKRRRPGKKN